MFKTLIKLLLTGVIFFMTMEMAARVHDWIRYDAPLLENYSSSRLRAYDSEGLRHNVPGSRFEKWQNNSNGFRGPNINKKKAEGTKRIFCMGASETYGLYESPGNEWPSQLQRLLSEDGNYEVINSAIVGFSINDYAAYFKKRILPFDPDIVVLLVSPYPYVISSIRKEVKAEHGGDKKKLASRSPMKKAGFDFSVRIIPKIKQTLKSFLPPFIVKKIQIYSSEKAVVSAERFRLSKSQPLREVPSIYINGFSEELKNLVKVIKKYGVEVVLTSYPMFLNEENAEKYPEIYLETRRFSVELTLDGMLDLSRKSKDTIMQISVNNNLIFIDLEQIVPKNTKYFQDNAHYTDEGASLVAQALASRIKFHYQKKISNYP